jgi:hypothetical protein
VTARRWTPRVAALVGLLAAALAVALAVVVAVVVAVARSGPATGPAGTAARDATSTRAGSRTTGSGFDWFRAQAAPAGWLSVEVPGQLAVLSYPSTAHPVYADPGAVAVAAITPAGDYATYLNATPRQGGESLANWTRFRLDHLADDTAGPAKLLATAQGLAFRGGTGSCLLDDYTSRVGAHRYREIACLVSGDRGDSVLVAATLAADWPQQERALKLAVESYTTGPR